MKWKRLLWAVLIVCACAVVSRFPLTVTNGHPWPEAVYQSFNSWGDAWVLPPRPDGAYMIYLAYYKRDGGRLDTNDKRTALKLKVVDETDDQIVPLLRNWEYGQIVGFKDWQVEEVANVRLASGHRYRIEVDPDQVKELARYRHRLGVDLDVSEKMNWHRRKGGVEPNLSANDELPARQKQWDPVELQKARAARKAWEAEKARRAQGP
jgi:hypothetical protein